MHLCIFNLGFGVFENFWVFEIFCEIVGFGVFVFILYARALHFHCILTMFHVFDIVECVLVGLDWVFTHDAI